MLENLKEELRKLRTQEVRRVAVSEVETDDGLQSRIHKACDYKVAARAKEASQDHIDRMEAVLLAKASEDLTPVLLADVGGKLFVIDGHHRLEAYRTAARKTLPARVIAMDMKRAVALSRLVNTDGATLPLAHGQGAELAWQYVTEVTAKGTFPLPKGESLRTIATQFGVKSPETIRSMLGKLKQTQDRLSAGDFHSDRCNPRTGWPLWKDARRSIDYRDWEGQITSEARNEKEIEKCAVALGKVIKDYGPAIAKQAMWRLTCEHKIEMEGVGTDDPF